MGLGDGANTRAKQIIDWAPYHADATSTEENFFGHRKTGPSGTDPALRNIISEYMMISPKIY